jgi:molybdopterin molybdotransferase
VIAAGIVRDDLEATRAAIAAAAARADVVMLSGGVSMGDYDLVKPALQSLGATVFVEKVAMHPGKPTLFATLGETLVFGLPGNPVSVAVSFHLFARPALLRMQGARDIHLPRLRAFAARADGRIEAEPLKWSGSSDLVAFLNADALIVVPEDRASLEEGELVDVISLHDSL